MGVCASAAPGACRCSAQSAATARRFGLASVSSSEDGRPQRGLGAGVEPCGAAARRGRPRADSRAIRKSAAKPKSPTPLMRASGGEPAKGRARRARGRTGVSVASAKPARQRRSAMSASADRRSTPSRRCEVSVPGGAFWCEDRPFTLRETRRCQWRFRDRVYNPWREGKRSNWRIGASGQRAPYRPHDPQTQGCVMRRRHFAPDRDLARCRRPCQDPRQDSRRDREGRGRGAPHSDRLERDSPAVRQKRRLQGRNRSDRDFEERFPSTAKAERRFRSFARSSCAAVRQDRPRTGDALRMAGLRAPSAPPANEDEAGARWSCVRFADLIAHNAEGRPRATRIGIASDGVWHYFWSED